MRTKYLADPEAHIALKKLYDERVRGFMNEIEFGRKYAIGTRGMVWQYLNGSRPLSLETAVKFANGLRCTIEDISPSLAAAVHEDVLPVLGRRLWRRRVSMLALACTIPAFLAPKPSHAFDLTTNARSAYYVKWLFWLLFRSLNPVSA